MNRPLLHSFIAVFSKKLRILWEFGAGAKNGHKSPENTLIQPQRRRGAEDTKTIFLVFLCVSVPLWLIWLFSAPLWRLLDGYLPAVGDDVDALFEVGTVLEDFVQKLDGLIGGLERERKRPPVDRDHVPRLQILKRLNDFGGRHVAVVHEPARQIAGDRNERQIDLRRVCNFGKVRAVSCVTGEENNTVILLYQITACVYKAQLGIPPAPVFRRQRGDSRAVRQLMRREKRKLDDGVGDKFRNRAVASLGDEDRHFPRDIFEARYVEMVKMRVAQKYRGKLWQPRRIICERRPPLKKQRAFPEVRVRQYIRAADRDKRSRVTDIFTADFLFHGIYILNK